MTRDQSPTPAVEAIGRLHLEGNIIPHSFFTRREFKSEKGVTQHLAILIYADDLYWYRPTYHRDELTGQILRTTRKFAADKLQRDYAYYMGLLGISKIQATAAVKFLVDRGLITREFRTVNVQGGRPIPNVMFVEPVVEALPFLLQPDEAGAPGICWTPSAPQPNEKKDDVQEAPRKGRRIGPQRQLSPAATASATAAVTAALASPPESKPDQDSGGVSTIEGIYPPNRTDTVSTIEGIYPPNRTDTNTEISSEMSSKISRGGVSTLESDPREGGRPSTPVAEPSSAAHSSSRTPAASTPTHEGGPLAATVGAALASVASVPTAAVLEAPDGVAAGAAGAGLQDSQDLDQPRAGVTEQATGTEQVPAAAGAASGGAAEGARGAGNGAGRAGVDSLRPVDAQVLAARPVALPESPVYKTLRSLVGNGLPELLLEVTRTGQISRALWLQLDEGEIGLAGKLAQDEAKATGANMLTLAVKGLDRLIGAVKAPKAGGTSAAAAPREVPVTGPQDLSHLDPQLAPGRRCTAFGDLGVVESATNASYVVLRDDGERVTVDRHVAGHLAKLKPSEAPLPEVKRDDVVVLAPQGSQWRPKKGGDVVTVVEVRGGNRVLSTGKVLADFLVVSGFERVTA